MQDEGERIRKGKGKGEGKEWKEEYEHISMDNKNEYVDDWKEDDKPEFLDISSIKH